VVLGIETWTSIKNMVVLEASIANVPEECCQSRCHCLTAVAVFILTANNRTQQRYLVLILHWSIAVSTMHCQSSGIAASSRQMRGQYSVGLGLPPLHEARCG